MKKAVIIGAGFAGIAAVKTLIRYHKSIDITLIDQKSDFNFLPMLPDLISKRVSPEYLTLDLKKFCRKLKIDFIRDKVSQVKTDERKVCCENQVIEYDYLLVATGTVTNFYGNDQLRQKAYTLDDVNDAEKLLGLIDKKQTENFVICGGGYTGIEIATNIRRYFVKNNVSGKKIIVVEKAKELLARLPEWMKEYCRKNLASLGIDIITDDEIIKADNGLICLKSGRDFDKACLIWTAGVTTAGLIRQSQFKTGIQGRVLVDADLKIDSSCFCAGDTAYFEIKDQPLRMGVQFAIAQGRLAAENIVRHIRGKKLKTYCPMDLGYIIPMANNKACGLVLGLKVKGLFAVFFHYFMCVFRTFGFSNQLGIIKNLARK